MVFVKFIALSIFYMILITVFWQAYEIKTFGDIQPNWFDTVITLLLGWSLAGNHLLNELNKELSK